MASRKDKSLIRRGVKFWIPEMMLEIQGGKRVYICKINNIEGSKLHIREYAT